MLESEVFGVLDRAPDPLPAIQNADLDFLLGRTVDDGYYTVEIARVQVNGQVIHRSKIDADRLALKVYISVGFAGTNAMGFEDEEAILRITADESSPLIIEIQDLEGAEAFHLGFSDVEPIFARIRTAETLPAAANSDGNSDNDAEEAEAPVDLEAWRENRERFWYLDVGYSLQAVLRAHRYDTRTRGTKPSDPGWHPCSCGWEGYWSSFEPHVADQLRSVVVAAGPERKLSPEHPTLLRATARSRSTEPTEEEDR